ncbi:hypothetical protein [Aquipuribacter sp. SD81]|uniref:hypothetical protein n=1 Tax=Aquipuribacter sp. SD81 TaxID=3127703 RepID=UPI00301B635C
MTRTATAAAALVGAAALALTTAGPAAAAPNSRGATEIVPNEVLASLLVSVDKPYTDRDGDGAPEFGIVGNPSSGVIKHVGGVTVTDLSGENEYSLRNFWIDTTGESITVSAVVNDGDRLELFDVGADLSLALNATSATVLTGDAANAGLVVGSADASFWDF